MSLLARIGRIAGIAGGAAALLAGAGAYAVLRRPLAKTNGKLRLAGLEGPVTVIRDHWGVPHIYAGSAADLFMAQGFVHAQERLWQMEFQRRLAHGRLAEILGPLALDSDRFVRILGFSRVARSEVAQLDEETHDILTAYVVGINAFIDQHKYQLPLEFTLLQLRPRPWDITDVLVWGKIMALGLCENWTTEILRARLVAAVGAARAAALDIGYPEHLPLIVPEGLHYSPQIGAAALDLAEGASRFIRDGASQGSNSWVVGGARSTSTKPLLANDPHLSVMLPSIWYENHLSGGEFHVTGASFPGAPGVVIGHNERIAWGVTNAMTDVQDLYIERFDSADPTRYEFQGEWERARFVREEISVRGQAEPVIEDVRITRHGPVITPLLPNEQQAWTTEKDQSGNTNQALALRWTALEPSQILTSALALNRARDWAGFRAALADWHVPAQNFVYADVEGHYGYALGGSLPIRARGDGRLPVPGWTGEYEWTGMIPAAELPHMLDPEEGFVVTANNRIVSERFPHAIKAEWLNGYRAARIRQLIEQTPQHNAETFGRIQTDQRSLPGLELAAFAGRLPATDPVSQQAREILATWDGELTAGSVGGTLYAGLRDRLLDAAYSEVAGSLGVTLGLGIFASLPGPDFQNRAFPGLLKLLAERDDSWLPPGRSWDAILAEIWQATIAELRSTYGDNLQEWRYGRAHTLTLRHPLGAVPALARLLNRGPFPTGGDRDTVCMGYVPPATGGPPSYVAPSYRQICDTADWNRSRSIHATGQSGQPFDRHYADFITPWLQGETHPMLWSRALVEEAAAGRLTLLPAS